MSYKWENSHKYFLNNKELSFYFRLPSDIFSQWGDSVRRPRSDLDLTYPGSIEPYPIEGWLPLAFTHLTVNTYWRLFAHLLLFFINSVELGYLRTNASLIHGVTRFTTKGIIGISRALYSRQLNPILDSAIAFHNRFYCFPDSHTTFICGSRSAAPFTSFVEIPSLLKVDCSTLTVRYPQVSLIR